MTVLEIVDAELEEFRRSLRAGLRRAVRGSLGQSVGGPAFQIVATLAAGGPLSPAELAAAMEVRTSTMAAHLDRLEELGWVEREPAGPNRVRVRATAAGRRAAEEYAKLRRQVLATLLSPLDPERLETLGEILRTCNRARRGEAVSR